MMSKFLSTIGILSVMFVMWGVSLIVPIGSILFFLHFIGVI